MRRRLRRRRALLHQLQVHERRRLREPRGNQGTRAPRGTRTHRGQRGNRGNRGTQGAARTRGDRWKRGNRGNGGTRGDRWKCGNRGNGGTGGDGGESGEGRDRRNRRNRRTGVECGEAGSRGVGGEDGGEGHVVGGGVSVEGGVVRGAGGGHGVVRRRGDQRKVRQRSRVGSVGSVGSMDSVGGQRGQRGGGDGFGLGTELERGGEAENGARGGQRAAGFEVVDVLADDVDVVGNRVADGEIGLRVAQVEEEDPVLHVEGVEVGGRRRRGAPIRVQKVQQTRDLHFSLQNAVDEADGVRHVAATTEDFENEPHELAAHQHGALAIHRDPLGDAVQQQLVELRGLVLRLHQLVQLVVVQIHVNTIPRALVARAAEPHE